MNVLIKRHYFDLPNGQLHYRISESQNLNMPPLMCFHMSPNSGLIYENLMSFMMGQRTMVAPDTPGFGMSDAPLSTPEITDYAESFLALMDGLGFHTVDVMGYHTGSMICIELARLAPDRIRRIIMVSAPIFTTTERQEFRDHYKHRKDERDGSHLAKFWQETLHWYEQGNGTISDVSRYFPDSLLGGKTAWWGHNAAFNYNLADSLTSIRRPILVINPNDDLFEYSLRSAPLLQNGRVINAMSWGHCFLDHHTKDAAELIGHFLDNPEDEVFRNIT